MTTAEILQLQREYFLTGETKSVKFRKKQLEFLKQTILANEKKIYEALKEDLGKSEIESYMCEVALVVNEIKYILKHLKSFVKKKKVPTSIVNFPASSYEMPCPKGNVLIMSPWNYPFMLTIEPLVDALAAGNTAIVKPSAYSKATSKLIYEMLSSTFEQKYVAVVTGGREVNQDLLTLKFDHIFFTGSKTVGHEVLRNAERNLTTVTLELGGKSPCIVDKTAPIALAAKRIVFGKFINCGQTCIAPDYILVHESVKEMFLRSLILEIKLQYGKNPLTDPLYGKIISEKHFDKVVGLLENQKVLYGGKYNRESLKIEPTVVVDPDLNSNIMTNEIFGPIIPVVTYKTNSEALEIIRRNDTPLAQYIFTKDKNVKNFFETNVLFGGGCINDTIMHISTPLLAFGGVGQSGMGAYHGKRGFDTFSHYKSIINKSTKLDLPLRYRPHSNFKIKTIKKFF